MAQGLNRADFQGSRAPAPKLPAAVPSSPREVSVHDLARLERKECLVLVDVREDSEWQQGHIPGAVHIRRALLAAKIRKVVPSSKTLVVCYCAAGQRSLLAADVLQQLGYTNVASLAGGTQSWTAGGLPLQKP